MGVKKILVSQPKPSNEKSPYFSLIEKYELKITFRPFIKVEKVEIKEFRKQRVNLADYTGVIFTGRTAVDHYFRLCEASRVSIKDTTKYFCVTEAIALYLQKYIVYRKRKIFFGKTGKVDDILPFLKKHNKEKLLLPVSDPHKPAVHMPLDNEGIAYKKAVMYRTVSNDFTEDEPLDYEMLVFFSPSGVRSLLKNFPNFEQKDIKIACFGNTTQKEAEKVGFKLDICAPNEKTHSMAAALENYLKEEK